MKFKEFLQSEGLYGDVKGVSSGEDFFHKVTTKQVKSPLGTGKAMSRMLSAGPKITRPARPAGVHSYSQPLTIPTNL